MKKIIDAILEYFGYSRKQMAREKRICSRCGKQIKRHERWCYFDSKPRHHDCGNPLASPIEIAVDDGQTKLQIESTEGGING
jgi:predicted amidophosphoribosyltransferase